MVYWSEGGNVRGGEPLLGDHRLLLSYGLLESLCLVLLTMKDARDHLLQRHHSRFPGNYGLIRYRSSLLIQLLGAASFKEPATLIGLRRAGRGENRIVQHRHGRGRPYFSSHHRSRQAPLLLSCLLFLVELSLVQVCGQSLGSPCRAFLLLEPLLDGFGAVHVALEGRKLLHLDHALGLLLEGWIGLGCTILEGLVRNVPLGCIRGHRFLAHGTGHRPQGSCAREGHHRKRRLAVHLPHLVGSNRWRLPLCDAVVSLLI